MRKCQGGVRGQEWSLQELPWPDGNANKGGESKQCRARAGFSFAAWMDRRRPKALRQCGVVYLVLVLVLAHICVWLHTSIVTPHIAISNSNSCLLPAPIVPNLQFPAPFLQTHTLTPLLISTFSQFVYYIMLYTSQPVKIFCTVFFLIFTLLYKRSLFFSSQYCPEFCVNYISLILITFIYI